MTKLHRGYTQEDVERLAAIVREADNWLPVAGECMELARAAELEDEWSAADADNSVKKTLCWVEYQIVHGTKSHPAYGDCFQDSFSWDWEDTVATAKFNREGLSPYDRAHQIVSAQRVEIEVDVGATPEEAYNDWTLACVGNADYVEFIDSAR